MRTFLCAIVIACVVGLITGCSNPATTDTRPFVRQLATERGVCSGVALSPGIILTASHCASGSTFVTRQGGAQGVNVALGDDRLDLALVRYPAADAACPCVRLASSEARVDETVYVVGHPRGVAQVVTVGASQGVHDNPNLLFGRRLVLTAPVTYGNSGGGVFVFRDGEFQLVGMIVEGVEHLSFAIPLGDIRAFLAKHA